MKNIRRVFVYCGFALLIMVLISKKCSMPSIGEARQRCEDACGKRGLFGRLSAPTNTSPRQTALDYECECY